MVTVAQSNGSFVPTPTLSEINLLEFLEQDSRAVFACHWSPEASDAEAGLEIVFANTVFQELANVRKLLENFSDPLSLRSGDAATRDFIAWAKRTSDDVSFEYEGLVWSVVTLRQAWIIISGVRKANYEQNFDSNGDTHLKTADGHDEEADGHRPRDLSTAEMFADLFNVQSRAHIELVLHFDWASTPLGSLQTWPQSLVQTLQLLFRCPGPCTVFLGPERILIYNEQTIPLLKAYHPIAMGASAKKLYESFWAPLESIAQEVEQTRKATTQTATRVLMDRESGSEEVFFTYSWVPLIGSDGEMYGIWNQPFEVTEQIVAQRHMNTLIKLGEDTSSATTLMGFWHGMLDLVQQSSDALPFVALYSLDEEVLISADTTIDQSSDDSKAKTWWLRGSVGFPPGHPTIPATIESSHTTMLATLTERAAQYSGPLLVNKNEAFAESGYFENCIDRGVGMTFSDMVVCPLFLSSADAVAFLVLGLNPFRPYDQEYAKFVNLLSRHVEGAATSVVLLQKEKRRLEETVRQAEYQRERLAEQLQQQIQEARESDTRFYNFAQQAPVGVYILGPTGSIKFCNDAWCHLVGIQIGYQGPVPWREHVHPDDLEAVDLQWQLLTQGHSQSNFEWRVLTKAPNDSTGEGVRYLRSSCFPELAADGSLKTVTGILMDISVHRAHERAAVEKLSTALEAKRAQENFMDMVSHEMRNPLNAILQCAEEVSQLVRQLLNPRTAEDEKLEISTTAMEAIDTIQWCGRHQKQIIDDVLTISKLDSNLLTLSPVQVTPVSIIDQTVKIFSSELRMAKIQVFREVASDGGHVLCLMDSGRVLQILINLVSNAIKFLDGMPVRKLSLKVGTSKNRPLLRDIKYVPSGRRRKQQFTAAETGSGEPVFVFFSVEDTGPGLNSAEMDSLFARFKQASPRTHARYGGSGLGLFISRELAELHGGEIGLTSVVQQGSTFAFYVEAYTVNQVVVASHPPLETLPNGSQLSHSINPGSDVTNNIKADVTAEGSVLPRTITILVVEDNLVNQKVLQRQLKRLGYDTITANHGEEALDIISHSAWSRESSNNNEKVRISIVLCDLEMPVMDGMTCIREIRQRQRAGLLADHIPVIAITGNARAEQVNAAKEAGFDDVVCKPYSVPDLIPLFHKLIK